MKKSQIWIDKCKYGYRDVYIPVAPGYPRVPGVPLLPGIPSFPRGPVGPGNPGVPGEPADPVLPGNPGEPWKLYILHVISHIAEVDGDHLLLAKFQWRIQDFGIGEVHRVAAALAYVKNNVCTGLIRQVD